MTASLAMYDGPAVRAANDALWVAIAVRLRARGVAAVPAQLDRSRPVEAVWGDPDLLLAQACGYPLIAADAPQVTVVALPRYRVDGCVGARHRSVIVARGDDDRETLADYRGARVAVNAMTSNTGMNLLRACIAPLADGARFFGRVVETGAHRDSAAAIGGDRADLAAVDIVTWTLLARDEPAVVAGLRVVARTGPSPSLPFVTARPEVVPALRATLVEVGADPALADVRAVLMLDAIETADDGVLDQVRAIERSALALGYPMLA